MEHVGIRLIKNLIAESSPARLYISCILPAQATVARKPKVK